jgi:pyruvate/2-oxoglutarate dehydrogenase complex dihydrolipoamide acyltransferase (E2) component
MVTSIQMPQLGMAQENITVVKWLKLDGTAVSEGEPVVVVESAKVSIEIEAPASGLVFKIIEANEKVKSGDPIGAIAESKDAFETYKASLFQKPVSNDVDDLFLDDPQETLGICISFEAEEGGTGGTADASQAVASDSNLPDVIIEQANDGTALQRIPFTGMRRTIARNLVSSLQTGAQLTVVAEADMTELNNFRMEMRMDNPEDNITFVDMFIKLVAFALKSFPILNSSIVNDEIVCWNQYHIGVAVALEHGLVVPVIRNADQKSLVAVSREVKKLSRKAQQNKLKPEDYHGGTFTLTSGGKVDVEFMTPIINPPQNAILGLGKIGQKPVVHQGQIKIRTMVYLCLTHDHRAVDGLPAAQFIGLLKKIIEQPKEFQKILK